MQRQKKKTHTHTQIPISIQSRIIFDIKISVFYSPIEMRKWENQQPIKMILSIYFHVWFFFQKCTQIFYSHVFLYAIPSLSLFSRVSSLCFLRVLFLFTEQYYTLWVCDTYFVILCLLKWMKEI